MRILVFLDTPRQLSYVASVEAATAAVPGVEVLASGPGAADGYFALAKDVTDIPDEPEHRIALATRIRLTLTHWRTRWRPIRKLMAPAWRTLKVVLRPFLPRPLVRPSSRLLRFGWHTIQKLPPLLQRFALFCLGTVLTMIAVVVVTFNAGSIMRQVVQRQIHIREAAAMIRRARPDVLVMMEDNVEGLTGVVTFAARRAGVPLIVLPDYIPNPIEPATYYWDSEPHQVRTLLDWLVAITYPKWKYRYNGRRMLRLPSVNIVAYHALRCDPPAPWILNSGYAAAIALDSMAIHARYRALGFRSEKLRVIGTAQDDRLHERFVQRESLRQILLKDLNLPNDRPIVLCAFPPNQYTTADTSGFEHSSYEALMDAWFTSLAAISGQANVIVRPHPRTKPGELEKRCPQGVSIVWTPTEELIPICDLYVASVSTTIRWALGLGLPVLNYDCYRYAYGDFTTAKGVLECSDQAAFSTNLRNLVANPDLLAAESRADRQAWGQVDGNYAGRLLRLLQEVSGSNFKAQSTHAIPLPGATLIRMALARARPLR